MVSLLPLACTHCRAGIVVFSVVLWLHSTPVYLAWRGKGS